MASKRMTDCDESAGGFPEVRPFKAIPLGLDEQETEGVVMFHYIRADERTRGPASKHGH